MMVIILIIAALSAFLAYWLDGKLVLRTALGIFAAIGLFFVVMDILRPGYTMNFWLGLDIFANTVLFGEVETISARLGRSQSAGDWFATQFCGLLDVLFEEEGHCLNAWEGD